MSLKSIKKNGMLNKQKGSALALSLFIIVIMTLLGTALVRMLSSNAETIVYEVLGTRAYQAAQTGSQRKLSEIFPRDSVSAISCPANNSEWDFSVINGLQGCSVEVKCTSIFFKDVTYYTITSTGQCTVASVVTSRTIEVNARNL
ncbi:type II secretory pathway component [Colwellia demingiae]|uniref:Type II secretory pathway component n=1 Tax=Colwellia demingiae TaxID=89401 RepID=A0A5C6QNW7_9GAMM|nr:pilus assembly PilX N-terminal domain-containing protein [Colwellia demingiae]TWX70674.1 type II secretory pathway component [Colwellia demingiae]